MNKVKIAIIGVLMAVMPSLFATIPSTAWLKANHSCTVRVTSSFVVPGTTFTLNQLGIANDGYTWYGSGRIQVTNDLVLTSSVAGYTTAWYSYAEDVQARLDGPRLAMKQLLSDGDTLEINDANYSSLYACIYGSYNIGIFYAVFTPITYKVKYVLNGGAFADGVKPPDSATYDEAFLVSAPTREGYAFAGWKVGDTLYFNGPEGAVSLINLTAKADEEVTVTATWKANLYPLKLIVSEGVERIICVADGTTNVTKTATTVQVGYQSTWQAWIEAAYGYVGSGAGADESHPQTGVKGLGLESFEPVVKARQFAITTKVQPVNAGSVKATGGEGDGSGNFAYGSTVTLTATPEKGYAFDQWSDGVKDSARTLKVTGEAMLTATFKPAAYTLTLTLPTGIKSLSYRVGGHGAYTTVDESTEIEVPYGATYEYYVEPAAGYAVVGSGSSAERPKTGTMGASATEITVKEPIAGGGANALMLAVSEGIAKIHWWTGEDQAWRETIVSTTLTYKVGTKYLAYADAKAGYTISGMGASIGSAVSGTISETASIFEPEAVANTYLVTVTANPTDGGTVKVNADGRFSAGDRAKVEANAYTGWIFDHWVDVTTAAATNVSANAIYDFTVTGDVFLEAVFVRENYTVTFVYHNQDGVEVSVSQKVEFGKNAVEPAAEAVNSWGGHAFSAWDSSDWQSVKGDCTIRANYSSNTYTVHFDKNGATSGSMTDQQFTYGVEQSLRKCAFERVGYVFAGWSRDATAESVDYSDEASVKNLALADTITLTAVWTPKTYTIVIDPGVASGEAKSIEVRYDENYTLPSSEFEYTTEFLGWKAANVGGLTYTNGETVARLSDGGTVTLVAQWAKTCQVVFHANYKGAVRAYDTQYFACGVENALKANTFTRTGYTFGGWTNFSDKAYADQELVTDPADEGETLDLYAVWEPITYQVVFDGNNPYQTTQSFTPDAWTLCCTYDVVAYNTVDDEHQVHFLGWSTTTDSADLITDASGGPLKNLTTISGDHIRLYAIWKKDSGEADGSGSIDIVVTNGWTACNGGFTNATDGAVLTTKAQTAGTVTFEWQPSARGEVKKRYAVTASAEPAAGGTVTGGGSSEYGSSITLTAEPNPGYAFDSWSDGATNNPYVINVLSATNLTARFVSNEHPLMVTAAPMAGGTVTGAGTYEHGANAELKATANTGYEFVGWSDGATENPHTVQVLSATNLTARFALKAYPLTLTVGEGVAKIFYALDGGAVNATESSLTTNINYGATYKLWATARAGYEPTGSGWSETDAVIGTMGTDGFTFAPDPSKRQFSVSIAVEPATGGTVTGSGVYEYGKTATIMAIANMGYSFEKWSDGITENPRTFTVVSATNLTAQFVRSWHPLTLTVGEGVETIFYRLDGEAVQVTSASLTTNVVYGTTYQLWAAAKVGYTLTGVGSSEAEAASGTMGTDGVEFAPEANRNRYMVSVAIDPSASGTVSGIGEYAHGAKATLTAAANAGYAFSQWSDGVTENPRTITVVSATNLVAQFTTTECTLRLVIGSSQIKEIGYRKLGDGEWISVKKTTEVQVIVGDVYQIYAAPYFGKLDSPYCYHTKDSPTNITMTAGGYTYAPTKGAKATTALSNSLRMTAAAAPKLAAANNAVAESPAGWSQAERLTTTKLTVVNGEGVVLTNLSGEATYDPIGGTCRWETVTIALPEGGTLSFKQDAGVTNGAALYPCMLRNVRFTEQPKSPIKIAFTLDERCGARIGGGALNQSFEIKDGSVIRPTEPTVVGTNGWDFDSWYDVDGGTNIAINSLYYRVVTNDTTFAAVFKPHTYGVLYANTRGHNNPNPDTLVVTNGVFGDSAEVLDYQPLMKFDTESEDTAFAGWTPSSLVAGVYGFADESTSIFHYTNVVTMARWKDMLPATNVYSRVTFCAYAAEGAAVDTNAVRIVERGKNVTDVPVFAAKVGYRFTGWDKAIDGVTESELTVTALYEPLRYPIAYVNLKGATHANPFEYTVNDAVALEAPVNSNANLEFRGWTTNGVATSGIAVGTTGAITFSANWAYRVTFARTADGHVAKIAGQSGNALTVAGFVEDTVGATNVPAVVCENGYSFAGWRDANGTVFEGEVVSNLTASVTLTAMATANVYRVKFIANGGVGTMDDQCFTYDVAQALAKNVFTLSEHTFAGWTNATASYADGAIVKNLATGGVVRLYAAWSDVPPTPPAPTEFEVKIDGCGEAHAVGETIVATAPFDEITLDGTNVVCTGWIGTGDVPTAGATTQVTFTVTQVSSLCWTYATNYFVSVTAGDGGSVSLEDAQGAVIESAGWWPAGKRLVAVATPAAGWGFTGWGDAAYDGSPCAFNVDAAASLTATFAKETYAIDYLGVEGAKHANTNCFTVTDAITFTAPAARDGYEFTGWSPVGIALGTTGDVVVRANWKRVSAYDEGETPTPVSTHTTSVAVDPKGSGDGTVSISGQKSKIGAKVRISASAKSGSVFSGWYTNEVLVSQVAQLYVTVLAEDVEYAARFILKSDDWAEVECDLADEYLRNETIEPVAVRGTGGSLTTVSVSGLPTGLKYANGFITGKPTKNGVYTVTLKATTVGKATATATKTVVIRGADDYSVTAVVCDSYGAAPECGKVTGMGVYATNKKVTLRATANRGYVFIGWLDGASGGMTPLSTAAAYAFTMPAEDVALEAWFITLADELASVWLNVNGASLIEGGSVEAGEASAAVGVYTEWPVTAISATPVTVTVSGLPSGLKFTAKEIYDKTSGRTISANTIYGTPTAASKTDRYGNVVPSTVKVTVTTAGKQKVIGTMKVSVAALPDWIVGTYVGGSTAEPIGSATLTVAKTGKISGKWISEGKTWTIAATGFTYGDDEQSEYTAEATIKNGKNSETVEFNFWVDEFGKVACDLFDATCVNWKVEPLKSLSTTFRNKTFTCEDDGYALSAKVATYGVVSVKGSFNIGATKPYTVTVSGTLVPLTGADHADQYELFIYYPYKANKFEGRAFRLTLQWDGSAFEVIGVE